MRHLPAGFQLTRLRVPVGSKGLTVFARSTTWISPQIAANTPKVDPKGMSPSTATKHYYIKEEKERFRKDPDFFVNYRKGLETSLAGTFPMFLLGSAWNLRAKQRMRERMLEQLGEGHTQLKEKLIPSWSPGCRRLTVSISLTSVVRGG
jgi:hypothetical protein